MIEQQELKMKKQSRENDSSDSDDSDSNNDSDNWQFATNTYLLWQLSTCYWYLLAIFDNNNWQVAQIHKINFESTHNDSDSTWNDTDSTQISLD